MQQFFVRPEQVTPPEICLTGPDVNHIRNVLRMRPGEAAVISDGRYFYAAEVRALTKDRVLFEVRGQKEIDTELSSRFYLFQGLPKLDKMDLIVQKAVELGVCEVIPVAMARSVVRLDAARAAKKAERWQKVAESAAKQAKRGFIPQVAPVLDLTAAVARAQECDTILLPYEEARNFEATKAVLNRLPKGRSVAVFIGPEGGFTAAEVQQCQAVGAQVISLGRRILRTETAGLMVLSVLMYLLEE